MVAILVGLIIGGIWIAREMRKAGQEEFRGERGVWTTNDQIETKADLVRAFHAMALKPTRNTEEWWTHSKVVTELVQDAPEQTESATVLADLYEQARYLPDDHEFSESQIREARKAIRQCEQ